MLLPVSFPTAFSRSLVPALFRENIQSIRHNSSASVPPSIFAMTGDLRCFLQFRDSVRSEKSTLVLGSGTAYLPNSLTSPLNITQIHGFPQ
jgi:hypothetical protein